VGGLHLVLGPRSGAAAAKNSGSGSGGGGGGLLSVSLAGGGQEPIGGVRGDLTPKEREDRVMARAHELDTPETRKAVQGFKGVGRYSDRTRRWYLLARDIVLGREGARATRWEGREAHIVLFATTWFGGLHKWATGYTECPPVEEGGKGCVISFYPDYMRSLLPHADVVLYHP
jgi:hypothetical protein